MQKIPVSLIDSAINARTDFTRARVDELAASIERDGCWPNSLPVVTPRGERFMIVAGECRIRAMRDVLGWAEIPCHVEDMTPEQAFKRMVSENGVRADINPIDEARAMAQARDDYGWSTSEIASYFGRGCATVRARLELVNLIPAVAELVITGNLELRYCPWLVKLDANRQILAIRALAESELTYNQFTNVCTRLQGDQDQESFFDGLSFTVEDFTNLVDDAKSAEIIDPNQLLGPAEVANLLGIARNTLAKWRERGTLPLPDIEISGLPIWKRATIESLRETRKCA